jgi:hypothetical protein
MFIASFDETTLPRKLHAQMWQPARGKGAEKPGGRRESSAK